MQTILESFERSSQTSSKSILTISSYTVSKLVRFLRHSADYLSVQTSKGGTGKITKTPVSR